MEFMKRNTVFAIGLAVTMAAGILTGCGNNGKAPQPLILDQ